MSHDKHPHPKPHEKPEPVEPDFTTQDDEPTLPPPGEGSGGGGHTDPDKPNGK